MLPFTELHITLKFGSTSVLARFTGGMRYPSFVGGKYSTDNADEQKQLEQNPMFNRGFKMVSCIDIPDPVKEEATAKTEQTEGIAAPEFVQGTETQSQSKQQEQLEVKDGITEVAGISSGQKAKDYIKEHYPDITFAQLRTNDAVKQVAKSLNIAFPDWKE